MDYKELAIEKTISAFADESHKTEYEIFVKDRNTNTLIDLWLSIYPTSWRRTKFKLDNLPLDVDSGSLWPKVCKTFTSSKKVYEYPVAMIARVRYQSYTYDIALPADEVHRETLFDPWIIAAIRRINEQVYQDAVIYQAANPKPKRVTKRLLK